MTHSVIQVENLWKRFKIPHEKKTTVFENILGIFQILGGRRFSYEEFWALKDINFSVNQGESIGVIGPNGPVAPRSSMDFAYI